MNGLKYGISSTFELYLLICMSCFLDSSSEYLSRYSQFSFSSQATKQGHYNCHSSYHNTYVLYSPTITKDIKETILKEAKQSYYFSLALHSDRLSILKFLIV